MFSMTNYYASRKHGREYNRFMSRSQAAKNAEENQEIEEYG